ARVAGVRTGADEDPRIVAPAMHHGVAGRGPRAPDRLRVARDLPDEPPAIAPRVVAVETVQRDVEGAVDLDEIPGLGETVVVCVRAERNAPGLHHARVL